MSWAGDEVLDRCTEAAGLEYDPVLGRRLIHQAEREIPGPPEETWAARLAMIGKAFGLRMTRVRWTVREAIATARPDMPVVVFVPAAGGEAGAAGSCWSAGRAARAGSPRPSGAAVAGTISASASWPAGSGCTADAEPSRLAGRPADRPRRRHARPGRRGQPRRACPVEHHAEHRQGRARRPCDGSSG